MVLMSGKCITRIRTAQYHFRVIFGLTPVPEDHVDRLDAGLDMEFLVDVIDVLADGFGTDEEFIGDFLIP